MNDESAWPELVYRLVEHYAWEPQHLRGLPVSEFKKAIRRQEPPLNLLFLLFLRWSPPEVLQAILQQFAPNGDADFGLIHLQKPADCYYTQPDVCVESETVRVFIELKVASKVDLQQVQKYLLLHAELDGHHRVKRPFLFFLTKSEFANAWKPHQSSVSDVQTFVHGQIASAPLPEKLAKQVTKVEPARYERVKQVVRYGAATWKSIGECLTNLQGHYEGAGGRDTEVRVITDFVADLKNRGLMVPAS